MHLITRKELAALVAISGPAITKAVKAGRVRLVGTGQNARVDITDPVNVEFVNGYNDRVRKEPTPSGVKSQKIPDSTKGSPLPPPTDEDLVDVVNAGNIGALSKASADRLKVISQIQQIQVKTAQQRGELIDRALVQRVISKLYTIDVNEFRTLGPNLAP